MKKTTETKNTQFNCKCKRNDSIIQLKQDGRAAGESLHA
jgi:hypothetical protein